LPLPLPLPLPRCRCRAAAAALLLVGRVNDDGLAGLHGGASRQQWTRHSLSYWHNRLFRGDPSLRFTAAVNLTTATESLFYTSIVSTGPLSAVILYNKYMPKVLDLVRGETSAGIGDDGELLPADSVNFAMRVTFE
jgi:hypothetical protein